MERGSSGGRAAGHELASALFVGPQVINPMDYAMNQTMCVWLSEVLNTCVRKQCFIEM